MDAETLKYPIGRYKMVDGHTPHMRLALIETIRSYPDRLFDVVFDLDEEQLDTPYREGGWTIRQVIHHLADSHINSYVRFHWALSEDTPTIKAYDQMGWSILPDASSAPILLSLDILASIHARWTYMLDHMSEEDFTRGLAHPEWKKNLSLDQMLGLYAWHGEHHKAHITELCKRMEW